MQLAVALTTPAQNCSREAVPPLLDGYRLTGESPPDEEMCQ
ncbi:hypothetical protein [Rhodococcus opacus]